MSVLNHQRRVLRAKFHNLRATACRLEHDGLLLLPPAPIPEGGSVDLPVVLAGLSAPDSGVRALFMAPIGVRDSELADRATGRVVARWLWRGRPAGDRSGFVCGCTLS